MPRPGITKEQVWQAAEALEREGANPTVLRVRAKLGSGSPNTITPYLAEWRKRREAPAASAEQSEAPPAVVTAVCQLWEAALGEAGARLQSERSSLAIAREELEHERAEALAEVERLDQALEGAQSELESTRASLNEELQAHAQTRTAADERAQHIKDLSRAILQAQKAAQDAVTRTQALTSDTAYLKKELVSAEERTRDLDEINKASREQMERLEEELRQARDRIDELTDELMKLAKGGGKR